MSKNRKYQQRKNSKKNKNKILNIDLILLLCSMYRLFDMN